MFETDQQYRLRLESQKWPEQFIVDKLAIRQNKATRRMKGLIYKASKALRAIKKLQARRLDRINNFNTRQQVKTLKAAKRLPHERIRVDDSLGWIYLPKAIIYNRNSAYVITSTSYGSQYTAKWGIQKVIQDYRPILKLDPPRNRTTIKSLRVNAFSSSIEVLPSDWRYQYLVLPKSKWALHGLSAFTQQSKVSDVLGFTVSEAQKAQQKALAKIYAADLNMNEYVVEYPQVLRLLKDPVKTVLGFHRVLERWTRKDSWMFIPHRTYRRMSNGDMLVSQVPLGGVLMSMRTRKTVSVTGMSAQTVQAAANRWLQYRYGIAPLALDIGTAMSLWENNVVYPPQSLKWKQARHWVTKSNQDLNYYLALPPFNLVFKANRKVGDHYTCKQWYRMKFDPPASYRMGLHPSQFLNIVWNALPWSFVADWVVNLDDWLTSTRRVPWIELGPNVITRKRYEKITSTCIKASAQTGGTLGTITGDPKAFSTFEAIRREVDMPYPTQAMLSNAWQTVKNAGTAIALLLTNFKNTNRR